MKEKTKMILLFVLAALLAISIFLNGWLLHDALSKSSAPENDPFDDMIT